jgi:hypothetical protein
MIAPATTTTDSIFTRALGLKRVTAISPYTEPVDALARVLSPTIDDDATRAFRP